MIPSVLAGQIQSGLKDYIDTTFPITNCLTGENANEKNLITGTRYLNVDGMLLAVVGYTILYKFGCIELCLSYVTFRKSNLSFFVGVFVSAYRCLCIGRYLLLHYVEEVSLHVLIRSVVNKVADLIFDRAETCQTLQLAVFINKKREKSIFCHKKNGKEKN